MSELKFANSEMTGFGSHSAVEVEQLQKALGLGGQGNVFPSDGIVGADSSYASQVPGRFQDGNALAVEDLDRTLKLVTFGLEHLRLWKDILKERVPQVVHEYNIQNAYGDSDVSPFFTMGSTPLETDAQYNRDVVQIKYMGTKGAVLHNLTLIQAAHGPVVAREVKNKTIELLARNERAMFDARSDIQTVEYDGIDYQIRVKSGALAYATGAADTHPTADAAAYSSKAFEAYGNTSGNIILNAGGADFDEDLAEDAALVAVNNFGMPMDMYLGTDIHSAFSRAFYAKQRTVPGESLTSGNRVTEHMGTLDYRFKPSLFNRPRKNPTSVSGAAQPSNLVISSVGRTVQANTTVIIVPVFKSGEAFGRRVQIGAFSNVSITTIGTGPEASVGGDELLYWNVYAASSVIASGVQVTGDFLFIRRIANAVFDNTGLLVSLAGLGKAYLIMHDPDVLAWKQLGSMIKYDLAVTTTQYEWLQLLYGTPLIMAPFKNVIIDNLKSN